MTTTGTLRPLPVSPSAAPATGVVLPTPAATTTTSTSTPVVSCPETATPCFFWLCHCVLHRYSITKLHPRVNSTAPTTLHHLTAQQQHASMYSCGNLPLSLLVTCQLITPQTVATRKEKFAITFEPMLHGKWWLGRYLEWVKLSGTFSFEITTLYMLITFCSPCRRAYPMPECFNTLQRVDFVIFKVVGCFNTPQHIDFVFSNVVGCFNTSHHVDF